MWLVHVRSFVARHRAVYWGAVAALGLTVALVLAGQSRQLAQARDAWGESAGVWVAAGDAEPGEAIAAERRSLPVAMVPASAVTGTWPAGAVAGQRVSSGEVVVATDLSTGRLPLLTGDRRAVAIAADETTVTVEAGDHVDVVAAGVVLADAAVVVGSGPSAVLVGVTADEAPAVATAAHDGTAVIVLRSEG